MWEFAQLVNANDLDTPYTARQCVRQTSDQSSDQISDLNPDLIFNLMSTRLAAEPITVPILDSI